MREPPKGSIFCLILLNQMQKNFVKHRRLHRFSRGT